MRKHFVALVLASSTAACSTDTSGTGDFPDDTGGDETIADSAMAETDPDTGMVLEDTATAPDDTGTATGTSTTDSGTDSGDVILPVDTSVLADTATTDAATTDTATTDTATADTTTADTAMADTFVADTFVADTAPVDAGSDTRTDALTDVLPDVPVMCNMVTCTIDATCTALGCGACNTGSGKCRM